VTFEFDCHVISPKDDVTPLNANDGNAYRGPAAFNTLIGASCSRHMANRKRHKKRVRN
jgi:hypothetical protein